MEARSGIVYRLRIERSRRRMGSSWTSRRLVRAAAISLPLRPSSPAESDPTDALTAANHAITGVLDPKQFRGRLLHRGSISLVRQVQEDRARPFFRPSEDRDKVDSPSNPSEAAPSSIALAERLTLALQPPLSICMAASGPMEWPSKLLDFQRDGIRVLVERPSVLLADDMGLGKTIQASAAMRLLARRGEVERILVVVPAAVIRNWRLELAKWAPELRALEITGSQAQRAWKWGAAVHVKIVSYETLRSDYRQASRHGHWDIVCLDEAQRIKNRGSAISAVIAGIESRRRWALTGTPLENSLDDVRSILSFLQPQGFGDQRSTDLSDIQIRTALSELQLRRKKADVLADLPPKLVTELFVPLTRQQRDEYEALRSAGVDELRGKGRDVTLTDVLALITHLKQICNFSTVGARSSKLDDLARRLGALREEGHKALVFSQFTSEAHGVRRIARALSAFDPVIYTGDMSADSRLRAIEVFQQDPRAGALILSLKAGGVGLNLQQASYVFHFDRWWNPASEAQAEGRAHRFGQTRGVNVFRYICEDTIEERIHEILQRKLALFAEYVDDVCLDLGKLLTEDEIFGLFGLVPPSRRDTSRKQGSPAAGTVPWVRERLQRTGFDTGPTTPSGPATTDIIARRTDELGTEAILHVRCIDGSDPVGVDAVRAFAGVLTDPATGVIACPSGFTDEAVSIARTWGMRLWTARTGTQAADQRLET